MADEEKTDWTGIIAVRRKRLVDGEVIEGTYEQLVLKLLKVIAADLDALALAEAERMAQAIEDKERDEVKIAKAKRQRDALSGPRRPHD